MIVAVALYTLAMVAANLSIAFFGPQSIPLNAFIFIGFDLVMRDWLGIRLSRMEMFRMILAAGAVTALLNPAAGMISVASTVAFMISALCDWATFSLVRGSWLVRSNASNVVGAAVDSVVFPLIAFSGLNPEIVLTMFAAKVGGGFAWSFLFSKLRLS